MDMLLSVIYKMVLLFSEEKEICICLVFPTGMLSQFLPMITNHFTLLLPIHHLSSTWAHKQAK